MRVRLKRNFEYLASIVPFYYFIADVELTKFKQCGVRDIIINEVQGQMQV